MFSKRNLTILIYFLLMIGMIACSSDPNAETTNAETPEETAEAAVENLMSLDEEPAAEISDSSAIAAVDFAGSGE